MKKTSNYRQLAKYGQHGHLGGFITSHLAGKAVESFLIDGTWLILRFTDGHEARIGWQDKSGNQLKGEPFLENLDVRIALPGADILKENGVTSGKHPRWRR